MKTAAIPPAIKTYYDTLQSIEQHAHNEGAVRIAFQNLLADWSKPQSLTVLGEQSILSEKRTQIRLDGLLVDSYGVRRGYWEAKDSRDDLELEIRKKIEKGYPLSNTVFEDTRQAVLYQNKQRLQTFDLSKADQLEQLLNLFVKYQPAHIEEFHRAVDEFTRKIPELVTTLTTLIEGAKANNQAFRNALNDFLELCRASLNKDTSPEQVEDMLKQHILTERIFRSIFNNPDFVNRNAVALELEKVVRALASRSFSRDTFLQNLNYFYSTIEQEARTITDYRAKQDILNNLYERFFQAYSTKSADTHGIVYTPAPIVRFMVASVAKALQDEFGLSLGSEGVHIIDPCVGTGTFMMELLQQIPRSQLHDKYSSELHANEVLLLPYYIASQNIEHAFLDLTNDYLPFEGICFADTLNLDNSTQMQMFAQENTERIKRQKEAPVFVVIGNPPYNAGQENENDNNKNRKYEKADDRIAKTYAKVSRAQLQTKLYDPYVKFFRWATDRLGDRDGIICYVSNNSFLNNIAFDGMRKQLLQDFDRIYTFDLGGNVRKNPRLSGTRHNVFGIQVGVCVTLLVRNRAKSAERGLYYTRLDEFWTKLEKLEYLQKLPDYKSIKWQQLTPDAKNNWLNEGIQADFDSFLPLGSKEARELNLVEAETIFKNYSLGVSTNRDVWVHYFDVQHLTKSIQSFIETYNAEIDRWIRSGKPEKIDDFVLVDDKRIKWSATLKSKLTQERHTTFSLEKVRKTLYRPFFVTHLYYDDILVDRKGKFREVFPDLESEQENIVICLTGVAAEKPFSVILSKITPNLAMYGGGSSTQCFPFYVYAEDGSNRRENITEYALQKFRQQYNDATISKWDIFHYIYAVLHSPEYRSRYAENLKRDLPRIPFVAAEAWRAYVQAGEKLATLHRDYEQVRGYSLPRQENSTAPLNWKVDERGMRLSPDKTSLRYNDFLTLTGIPPKVFEYKLGSRSALEWVIDQYRVSEDKRSGLRHDPNNPDDPQYILKLVEKVVRVSLDTLTAIESLPPLLPNGAPSA